METKKAGILGACLILVVMGVVGTVAYVKSRPSHENNGTTSSSLKAIEEFCQNSEYKETCVKSISSVTNSTNTTELINVGFQETIKELRIAQEKALALEKAATDPVTVHVFQLCQRLLDDSIEDLEETLARLNSFDQKDVMLLVDDVKTWLTGAATSQQTCLDSFQELGKNEAAEQMKQVMKVGSELTTDALGMVDQVTKVVETDDISGSSRRLLGLSESEEENWRRRLSKIASFTPQNLKPNLTVELDPSGEKYVNGLTIDGAIKQAPNKTFDPFIIYVKAGVYRENVTVYKEKWNVMLIGDGPDKTVITYDKSNTSGFSTFDTPTLIAEGRRFTLKDMRIENSAGILGNQSAALRVSSDYAIIHNCQLDSYQDTLYVHKYRQFYRDCTIRGTIDYIFGNARAVFQNCTLKVMDPSPKGDVCTVTAQGRLHLNETSAIILQNCKIVPDDSYTKANKTFKTYLGRPWKEYARTIVMDSFIHAIVDPEGWTIMTPTDTNYKTCLYIEHGNNGTGAYQGNRVKWPSIKNITDIAALDFTPAAFFRGDNWIKPATWLPYESGRVKIAN